jgi:protein-disulfide isomerase
MLPSDKSLMLAVRDGEVDQFGELFRRHHHRLFAFFYRMTARPAVSEDLVQEVFVRMLKYRGSSDAAVTLVEYGDYACPPCAVYNPILNQVLEHYGNKVRLEFRDYPMMKIHPNALKAALAAEAACHQGRYWEMHELLLSSHGEWSRADDAELTFRKLAASLGLDTNRFLEATNNPKVRERVMADISKGQQMKIEAVPAFFLNGRQIKPLPTTEAFFALIDAELQRSR